MFFVTLREHTFVATMKTLRALLVLAVLAGHASAETSLVSWYRAEGNVADFTGSNTGVLTGAASFGAGAVGQAFKFGGVTDSVRLADSLSLTITRSLTISAYVYVNAFPASTSAQGCIVFRGDQRPGFDPYVLSVQPSGLLTFHVATIVNGVDSGIDLTAGIASGQWVAVTATLDDATGVMSLYENGFLVNRTVTPVRPFATLDPGQNPGVGIGNHSGQPMSTQHQPFNGLIDEVKIYNTVVPPVQRWRTDVDQNGTIDIRDAAKALRIIAGLDPG
jgi:hypothetical protein